VSYPRRQECSPALLGEPHTSGMRFFRAFLEENLYQKAVNFKDIKDGKFQNFTKRITEVNSTVTKSTTVKCILSTGGKLQPTGWKHLLKISVQSTLELRC
jgi:hypothetical protein